MSELAAMKFDGEKPRTDLVPWDVVLEAAKVFTYGAAKYDDRNYFGLSQSRLYGAVQRHLIAWYTGEDTDPETGESHLSHALCGVMMLLEKEIHELGEDDRPWSAGRVFNEAVDEGRDARGTQVVVSDATGIDSSGIGGKWARRASGRPVARWTTDDVENECVDVAAARRA